MWSYRYWELKLWLESKLGCNCKACLQARFIRACAHCRIKEVHARERRYG